MLAAIRNYGSSQSWNPKQVPKDENNYLDTSYYQRLSRYRELDSCCWLAGQVGHFWSQHGWDDSHPEVEDPWRSESVFTCFAGAHLL